MPKESKQAGAGGKILTRTAVVERIGQRLAGGLGDAALAAWAFESFYAVEAGAAALEIGSEQLLGDALDALMFGDDPAFQLNEEELRALAERLMSTGSSLQ
jgi:hypothetical protein